MKLLRVFLITAFFVSTFFIGLNVKAADNCSTFNPLPPAGSTCCIDGQCNGAALGDYVYLRVYAKDEDGNIIVGAPTSYVWQVVSPALGVIESPTNPNITSTGQSVARLKISFTANAVADKRIIVTATYGGYTKDYTFNILATCQSNPNLYYGIGGVSKQGKNQYNYSTAEVLSSCYDEYRLYEGDGSK